MEDVDYTQVPSHTFGDVLRDDARKWGTAFKQHADKQGVTGLDEEMAFSWFANAIELSYMVRNRGVGYGSKTAGLNFGQAIQAMEDQHAVQRAGWNGKGMFIVLMPPLLLPPYNTQDTNRKVNDRTAKWIGVDAPLDCQPYFAMYTAQKQWQPGWLASQADMLARDWQVFEPEVERP